MTKVKAGRAAAEHHLSPQRWPRQISVTAAEPAKGYLSWHADEAARRAVYANRARLKSGIGRETMRRRGELVERSSAHTLDRGGHATGVAAQTRELSPGSILAS